MTGESGFRVVGDWEGNDDRHARNLSPILPTIVEAKVRLIGQLVREADQQLLFAVKETRYDAAARCQEDARVLLNSATAVLSLSARTQPSPGQRVGDGDDYDVSGLRGQFYYIEQVGTPVS